ncbi:MAG: chemotaxis protein CheW [Campylobacterota bacterium]
MDNIDQVTGLYKNNEVQLMCFQIAPDSDIFAINVYKIREIIKYKGKITDISSSSQLILGLVTLRRETIPVVDLKKWFHYDALSPQQNLDDEAIEDEDVILAICEFSSYTVGIRIHKAERIITKNWSEIFQVENSFNDKINNNTRYYDGRLVQIVDIERMLIDAFPWLENEKNEELESIESLHKDKFILLAEDSPSAMNMMKKILKKLGVKFHAFINGQLLLDHLFSHPDEDIGMIITDLEMPVASGFEVIKQTKADKRFEHIPIVVNSSMSGASNEQMAKSLNAQGFISKSNPKEIKEVIQKFM